MKAEPTRLIPRKLEASLEILLLYYECFSLYKITFAFYESTCPFFSFCLFLKRFWTEVKLL